MNEPTPQPPARRLDLDTFLLAIREQRSTFILFFACVLFASVLVTVTTKRKYSAVALIQLMPRAGREVDVNEVVKNDDGGYMESRDRARTQIQIILSRSVLEAVIRAYNAKGYDDLQPTSEGVGALLKSMSVGPREDTQLVEIGVTHVDPEQAAILANLVADVYAQSNLDARTDAARETKGWIDARAESSRADLEAASSKVMAFKQEHDLVDVDEKVNDITTRMSSLQAALGEATTQRVLLQGQLDGHTRLLNKGEYEVLAGMFQDPALETLSKQHATIVADSAEVLARYGDQHPEHQRAVERIARVEALLKEEVVRNVDGERARVQTLARQEAQITEELDKVKAELLEKQRLQEEYGQLKLEEDRVRKLYGSLGDRGTEVDLQARSRLNDVRIVDRAVAPTSPSTPNVTLNLGVALVIGIGGGLALALVRHRLTGSILSAADVEQNFAQPLLGVIPRLPRGTSPAVRALYAFEHPRSLPAESIRGLRAMLQTTMLPGEIPCFLVTSCGAGEGKSFVAVNLAVAFAQLGMEVVLIDADLRLPSLHTTFGLPAEPGLSDALVPGGDPRDHIVATNVPRLHLLPRGSAVDYPNELLASNEVERLLAQLGETYQIIIVDTPPAALVSDALSLARAADGVIMVVRRGRVSRSLAAKTMARFRQMGARVLGVALNDMPQGDEHGGRGARYYNDEARAPKAPKA